jgi:membrane protein
MPHQDHPEKPGPRSTIQQRLASARNLLWSNLTDPAVLVYRRTAKGGDRARVLLVEFLLFVREVVREFYEIEGMSRAASLAYTTLLSLIPLLVAFNQVLQRYFAALFPDYQTQIDTLLNSVIPYQSPQITYALQRFAENAGAFSTFGAVAFLIVSFRLFLAVEGTVNQIWKVRSDRGYRQKIMAFTMLFFWGPLLMGLSFTTTAMLQRNRYLRVLFAPDSLIFVVFPVIVLFVAFTMLFWLVPSTRVQFRAAAAGACVTTLLFSLVRYGFGVYASYLFHGRLNVIYGTVGLALIFLLAIEIMWVVVLIGVEISYVSQNLSGLLRASEQQILDEPRYDTFLAIRSLVEISRRFDRREQAPSAYLLAAEFGSTDAQMMRILRKLEDAQLVREVGGEWAGFVPGCDPDRIMVEEVMHAIQGGTRAIPRMVQQDDATQAIAAIFDTIERSTSAALERDTIGHLVSGLTGPRQPSRIEDRFTRRE